jgi:hypothetical protein
MKKLLLTTVISAAIITSTAYATGPATSGLVFSGEGSYSMPSKMTNQTLDSFNYKATVNNGFGLGAYIGYDYAISSNVTLGAKTGYFHSFGVGKVEFEGQGDSVSAKVKSDNIPLLLNAKYYFNSGLYLGGETGVNFQKLTGTLIIDGSNKGSEKSDWKAQYLIGALIGYQASEALSIEASIDYTTGNSLVNTSCNIADLVSTGPTCKFLAGSIFNDELKITNPLSTLKFGISVNYKLPM